MMEKEVRRVMIKYFESKNLDVVPQSGAGPDLHLKGKGVVEVKGTKYKFSDLVKQLVDYATKHREVGLAMPFDCLDLKKIEQIEEVERLIDVHFRGIFTLFIVVPMSGFFLVRDFKNVSEARAMMTIGISHGIDLDAQPPQLDKFVQKVIAYSPTWLLKSNVCFGDKFTAKIEI